MATIDNIRNGLIDKILTIQNKEFLKALNTHISSSAWGSEIVKLLGEQKQILQMNEGDILNGRLISQNEMDRRNLEWLNAL